MTVTEFIPKEIQCPSCGGIAQGEPRGGKNQAFRCISCNRIISKDNETIEPASTAPNPNEAQRSFAEKVAQTRKEIQCN